MDATCSLHADPVLAAVPFVVFSSSSRTEEIEQCEAAGVSEYASKPIGFEAYERVLVDLVRRWLPGGEDAGSGVV